MTRLVLLTAAASIGLLPSGCTMQAEKSAPAFDKGSGQQSNGQAPYPDGPYGLSIGSVIRNVELVGYQNFKVNGDALSAIKLSDFYNPTGQEVFGEELAGFGVGSPKPKALNLIISSSWCPPCQDEAANVLPDLFQHYKPIGGHFMTMLIDGPDPGTPATLVDLYNWASFYDIDYTMTMEPTAEVMAYYEPFFPGNIIVRTADMKIIETVAGVPGGAFWNTFNQVLDGTYADPEEGI